MAIAILDATGTPLAVGDRVAFRDTYYYLNMHDGAGIVRELDIYGGISIDTDEEMRHCDRNGAVVRMGKDWYFCTVYDYERKARVARSMVGDPHEHIPQERWVRKTA